MKYGLYLFVLFLTVPVSTFAGEFLTTEPDGASYQYVSNYSVEINGTQEDVWNNLVNLKSWMYEFEMSHVAGEPGEVGEVLRLYPNQDFFIQITGKVKGKMLTISNLPSTFGGEFSTGVGVISVGGAGNKIVVNLVMSRRYTWDGEDVNPMKEKRSSKEFQEGTGVMWNKFLVRLKALSEKA